MNKENSCRKVYWRPKNQDSIEFLDAKLSDCTFAPHIHDAFTVTVVENGTLNLSYKTGSVVLHPGVLFIAGSQVPQGVNVSGQKDFCLYKSILMNEQCISSHFPTFFKKYQNAVVIVTSIEYSNSFIKTIDEIEKTSNTDLEPIFEESEQLFNQMSKGEILEKIILSEEVGRIKDFIDHNFLNSLNINCLANVACFSYSHLIRKFKSEVGLSPYAYLIQKKITEAKKLLIGSYPLISVAHDLGFYDQSHFSKTFKKVLGVSPIDYIEMKKGGLNNGY